MTLKVIKLPDIGEGVAEAEVVEWHVGVGDEVAEDQILAAVMTDKATVEIPSPFAGKVARLGGEVGAVLAVGSPLIEIETEGQAGSASEEPGANHGQPTPVTLKSDLSPQRPAVASERAAPPVLPVVPPAVRASTVAVTSEKPGAVATRKPVAAPSVRGRALEAGVDLRQVHGTGPAGRITHDDLDHFLRGDAAAAKPRVLDDLVEKIKLVGLRRKIAERMTESGRQVVPFSYIEEVDVTSLEELRADLNRRFAADRPKLSLLPFLVRALVVSLRDFPQMNALYDDDTISQHRAVHVGIATQTSAGLMVPVVRNAGTLTLWECAAEIGRLAQAARDGSASRADLSGSTITITSLGELGGLATTPVINRPEVAIVGVNRMSIRPVWLNNQFVPRKMMNLSSSFDHRVIDGDSAARFIQAIKRLIELPANLFIEN